jgi:hypothetical protein
VISPWSGNGIDRFGVKQTADDHPASVLARVRVRPAQLVRDAFAVPTESDVVDPAKAIKVFSAYRDGHGVPRFNQYFNPQCRLTFPGPRILQW